MTQQNTTLEFITFDDHDDPEKTYAVKITMHNTLDIKAHSKEEAAEIVRNSGLLSLIDFQAYFTIAGIEEVNKPTAQ